MMVKKYNIIHLTKAKQFFKMFSLAFLFSLNTSTFSIAQTPTTYWWNDVVFYEVFLRSFKDNNGDGKGDFKGLTEKLDYLNDGNPNTNSDLGVTGIWLMPIQQSPSYHGYDVIDYRAIEQDYGTNQDFKDFIAAAHSRGIKVIIDYVMNHSSSQHPWFTESATGLASSKRDWYVWNDTPPAMTGPWGQNVWHTRNASKYYGIFWSEMPDLNYNTQAVKDEMFDIATFWLEDMEVDGFRLDAIKYIKEDGLILEDTPETIDFWKDFRTHYKSINSNALSVGEAWTSTDKVAPYVGTDGLDFCFEFDLAEAILTTASNGSSTALKAQIDEVVATYPHLQFGTFLTNHDINRVMNRLGYSTAKAKVAASILLTLPGVPYIYYGEEIGMTGAKPDENIRTPLQWNNTAQGGFTTGTPWRAVNADYTTKNIESQQLDANSLWSNYRKLISLRNNQIALRRGTYKAVASTNTAAFSFLRQYNDENVLVVSNPTATALTNFQLSSTLADITPGNYIFVDLLGGTQIPVVIDVNGDFSNLSITQLPAYGTQIYKLMDAVDISTTVTFMVNMNEIITAGNFNPLTETVDVVADFNSFGSAFVSSLDDVDDDGIYSLTVSSMNVGSKVNYKFRINAINDARTEFASTAYLREYFVVENEDSIQNNYQMESLTNINRSSTSHAMSVYPVPTTSELFIDNSHNYSGIINYQLSDLAGKNIMASSFEASASISQYSLALEDIKIGTYLLTLDFGGKTEVFRIVIQK